MVISDGQYFLWWFCSLNLLSRWTYKVFSDTVWLYTFIISNEVHYVIMNLKYWTITLNLNANSLWRAVFLMPAMFGIRCVVGVQGFYDFCNLWQKIKIVLCVNWLAWRTLFATSTLVAAIVEPVESISSEYPRSGLPVGPLSSWSSLSPKIITITIIIVVMINKVTPGVRLKSVESILSQQPGDGLYLSCPTHPLTQKTTLWLVFTRS